jgi:mannose-6-phosphate isomerase
MKKIKGVVKHYDWGGKNYLPELLKLSKTGDPFAEYWLGTHPDGSFSVVNDDKSLSEYRGTPLPFLFKILDVRDMLSIQVHPDKATAEKGFIQEERSGKPRHAYDRVFKDDNHKPELMVALSEFWLVQGFQSDEHIRATLSDNPELKPIADFYSENGLAKTYAYLMTMPQEEVNAILKPLGQRIKPLYESNELPKEEINFWAARAYFTFNKKGVCDRGIFSLYLMNLVKLSKGEGIYQAPGVLHAYLEGQNVECMAASDNVVRGGLTSKHIDTEQLISIVRFEHELPQIITPQVDGSYQTPAAEFQLKRIVHGGDLLVRQNTLVVNRDGPVQVEAPWQKLELRNGEAIFIEKECAINLASDHGEPLELFLAAST